MAYLNLSFNSLLALANILTWLQLEYHYEYMYSALCLQIFLLDVNGWCKLFFFESSDEKTDNYLRIMYFSRCLTRFEEQNGYLSHVEVDKVLRLMSNVTKKI